MSKCRSLPVLMTLLISVSGFHQSAMAFWGSNSSDDDGAFVERLKKNGEGRWAMDVYEQLSNEYLPEYFTVYFSRNHIFNDSEFSQMVMKGGSPADYRKAEIPVVNDYEKLAGKTGYIACTASHDPQYYGLGYYFTAGYWEPSYDSTKLPNSDQYLFGLIRVEGQYNKAATSDGFLFQPLDEGAGNMFNQDSFSSKLCNRTFAKRCAGLCHGNGETYHLKPRNIEHYTQDPRVHDLKEQIPKILF